MSEDRHPADELLPELYEQLRSLARAKMASERPGHTIQATVLVHEAYVRLVGKEDPGWKSEGHFFGAAARAMRRILVEQARARGRLKRGGGADRADLDEIELVVDAPSDDVLAVDEAVRKLEAQDRRKGQIVNLRYFAGLTNEEVASALGLSVGTIEREWRFIRSWLQSELG